MSTTKTPVARWAHLNGFAHGNRERHAQWLREQELNPKALEAEDFPADPVTLDQWAQFIGENPVTVKSWQRRPDWNVRPRVVGPGWATVRRGKSPNIFSLAELDAYPRPKNRHIDPTLFKEDELLTLRQIAERAGLPEPGTALHQYDNDHHRMEGFPEPVPVAQGTGPRNARLYHARRFAKWFNANMPGRRGRTKGSRQA